MLPVDNEVREEVLTHTGNIVISASAGTGKTHTTVQRIRRDLENNRSFRTFAAITFTRKAARVIANRLGLSRGYGFVGTNDYFVWSEIIQPFMYDAYGREFKKSINPDYSDANRINSFDEGVEKIRATGLMCKYADQRANFAFQLALNVLQNSHAARRFLKEKYFRIYIDEYQDCDADMHNFFMYLCDNLKIPLFVVGDTKQSIYGWRGAYSDGFKSLFDKDGFNLFLLWHNFRSNTAIQNYSNIFLDSVREYYTESEFNDEVILLKYSKSDQVCEFIKEWINEDKNCAFLNYRNGDAIAWSEKLAEYGLDFKFIPNAPINDPSLESEHVWIARGTASYILTKRYSEFDFRDEIPIPENYQVAMLRSKLQNIKQELDNWNNFQDSCFELYAFLGYDQVTSKIIEEVKKLYDTVSDERYIATFNADKYLFTSSTIHSAKGVEYSQVIINAEDYRFHNDDNRFLHYVAVSRPEDRLLIIAQDGFISRRYIEQIKASILEMSRLGYSINQENIISIIEPDH